MTACVVIPIYKKFNDLHPTELLSLNRCLSILKKHDVWFIGPKALDFTEYTEFTYNRGKRCNTRTFDAFYFKNIEGYNKLLKSLKFYYSFKTYDYILIYQTDAYVFKDELLEWCSKGYDYIGAPWLDGWTDNTSRKIIGVGNGGFSLHHVKRSIKVLKKLKILLLTIRAVNRATYRKGTESLNKFLNKFILQNIFGIKNAKYIQRLFPHDKTNEDVFWGLFIPSTFREFKVASSEDALKFGFEVNPRYMFELNDYALPFGCHAWLKYDPEFWQQYIKD